MVAVLEQLQREVTTVVLMNLRVVPQENMLMKLVYGTCTQ